MASSLKTFSVVRSGIAAVGIALLVAACGGDGGNGGGGSSDSNIGFGSIRIGEPVCCGGAFTTPAPSVQLEGSAFVSPDDVDCVVTVPIQLSLSWQNDATGQSGTGVIRSFCATLALSSRFPVTQWVIPEGIIDLQMGVNRIRVTAADSSGNQGSATITVERIDGDQGGTAANAAVAVSALVGIPTGKANLSSLDRGSDPNAINPNSMEVIPVAVLGSVNFDATQVDFSTAKFGPGKALPVHDGHVEDVNDDDFLDMVFHFNTQDTGIACIDNEATLSGQTFGGDTFTGTDSVKTAGCK